MGYFEKFAKSTIENGGDLIPMIIDSEYTNGLGITNGSIYPMGDKIYVKIRHVEYCLYVSEKVKYPHPWGPIVYLHPEDDWKLRTNNYLGVLTDDHQDFKYYSKVDTSKNDVESLWDFVGLEDARIVYWDDKMFLTGVRRDTTKNGVGRMELVEVVEENKQFKEISRQRIPIPGEEIPDTGDSYCEKNWMPVVDQPYTWVKWCNPVEVVRYNPETKLTEQIYHGGDEKTLPINFDFRGGSQVIPYKDGQRFAITHLTNLYKSETGRKNCTYRHRFIVFDDDWNVVRYSDEFDFIDGVIEFSCGMCLHEGKYMIPFGYQDNTSFLLKVPQEYLYKWIEENSDYVKED